MVKKDAPADGGGDGRAGLLRHARALEMHAAALDMHRSSLLKASSVSVAVTRSSVKTLLAQHIWGVDPRDLDESELVLKEGEGDASYPAGFKLAIQNLFPGLRLSDSDINKSTTIKQLIDLICRKL